MADRPGEMSSLRPWISGKSGDCEPQPTNGKPFWLLTAKILEFSAALLDAADAPPLAQNFKAGLEFRRASPATALSIVTSIETGRQEHNVQSTD